MLTILIGQTAVYQNKKKTSKKKLDESLQGIKINYVLK
jgi:hypothetical protein